MRRAVAGLAVTLAMLSVGAALAQPVWAHAEVVGSTPRNGAIVRTAPESIVIRFGEEVALESGRLIGPDGSGIPARAVVDGSSLIMIPEQPLSRGPVAATWNVRSADGHAVSGSMSFVVGPRPATGSPRVLTSFPRVVARLGGSRPGQLTLTLASSGTGGQVQWSSAALPGPITWPLVADGKGVAGRGVLPFPGTWTYSATISKPNGSVLVVTGSGSLARAS